MEKSSPRRLTRSNPVRQAVLGYAHAAGIEIPYTFFAPNVPESFTIRFNVHCRDRDYSYTFPSMGNEAATLRLTTLIDTSAGTAGPWRDIVVQMLAGAVSQKHPDAAAITAEISTLHFPPPADYLRGARPSSRVVCRYDFTTGSNFSRTSDQDF